jgi:hypothetical protein
MKLRQFMWIYLMVTLVSGCSAHNPFIIKNTNDTVVVSQTKHAPHHNPVYVMESSLPSNAKYEVLGQLEVGKVWYGSSTSVLQSLADGARENGADSIIEVKTWFQPSGWSWAAPHGSGKAIKIIEPASVDFGNLNGVWR